MTNVVYTPRNTQHIAVDLLRSVGLRENDLSEADVTVVNGPTNELDAFMLERSLTVDTDEIELDLIGVDLLLNSGIFTIFNSYLYRGLIFSIGNGTSLEPLLEIELLDFGDLTHNYLLASIPGVGYSLIKIPVATETSQFQNIGIRLKDSKLVVVVNCSIVEVLTLDDMAELVLTEDGVITIFGSEAIVSLHVLCILKDSHMCNCNSVTPKQKHR